MPYDWSTWDRDCQVEQTIPLAGSVTGEIPAWLRGSFVLNGPGKLKYGDQEYKHVFDGASILQKFDFTENGPVYTNRYLRTNAFAVNTAHQQIVVSEFGTKGHASDSKNLLQKIGDKFSFDKLFSDNAPINLVHFGGELYANTEAPFLHKIDPKTLETTGKVDLHKELGINSQCPHPMPMPDGSSINILHEVGATGPRYGIVQFAPKSTDPKKSVFAKPIRLAAIDTRWKLSPCHLHSFGMTDNYVIIPEQPLTIDVKAMVANTVKDRPFIEGMEWMEGKMVKLRVVDKRTGKEVKINYKTDAFHFLHVVNSYEREDHVVIDLCVFSKPELMYLFYLEKIRAGGESYSTSMDKGSVIRLVLPLKVNEKASPEENLVSLNGSNAQAFRQKKGYVRLVPEVLATNAYENPALNPAFNTKAYQYFYGSSSDMSVSAGAVAKIDVNNGEVKLWSVENLYSSVVVFAAKPGSQVEDEGVLLMACLRGGGLKNEVVLVVLDTKTMQELATVVFPTQSDAPRSLHGIYLTA